MAFTHLHVHTEYSLLDGASRIGDIVARAKELGSDYIVVGRPITQAADPLEAYRRCVRDFVDVQPEDKKKEFCFSDDEAFTEDESFSGEELF